MRVGGIALAVLGLLLAIGAFLMGSTVPQEVPYSPDFPTLTKTQDMHNLPRAQQQLLLFMGGSTLFLAGIILAAIGALIEFLQASGIRSRRATSAVEAPQNHTLVGAGALDAEVQADTEAVRQSSEDDEKEREQRLYFYGLFATGLFVLLLVIAFAFQGSGKTSSAVEQGRVSQNVEMTADNLEVMADRLEQQAEDTMNRAKAAGLE